MSFDKIINDIKRKNFKPLYLLHGEEDFYIDKITDEIEANVLSEAEKAFNQTIVYGKDINATTIMDIAMRYPMGANYSLVIVKEAQHVKDIKKLEVYAQNPLNQTVLVLAHKHKKATGTLKWVKLFKKNGLVFEAKKVRDYELPNWIQNYAASVNLIIPPKAVMLLSESLGTDLSKIVNELEKLQLNLKDNKVTIQDIEKYIGINKDYNVFEFTKTLGEKNFPKALKIIKYFEANSKSNPMPVILGQTFSFYFKLYATYGAQNIDDRTLAATIGVHPFFVKEYKQATKKYSFGEVEAIIQVLQQLDLRSKGVGGGNDDSSILHDLIFKIQHIRTVVNERLI